MEHNDGIFTIGMDPAAGAEYDHTQINSNNGRDKPSSEFYRVT
jgi:hypothetical protein